MSAYQRKGIRLQSEILEHGYLQEDLLFVCISAVNCDETLVFM
jgi:hypothetical protein